MALLASVAAASPFLLGWISVAPNRLVTPRPVPLPADPGVAASATGFVLCCLAAVLLARREALRRWAEAAAAVAAVALLLTAGLAAGAALEGGPNLGRAALATGVWIALMALALAGAACAAGRGAAPAGFVLLATVGTAALVASGALDALSLLREAASRGPELRRALGEHLLLAGGALALALLLTLPLCALALTRRRLERALLGLANGAQVVPSIALFGLLMGPLTALADALPALRRLGVAGIGAAPAILGIAAYLVLPLARATLAGLRAALPAVLDAARGQGMTPGEVLRRVRLPLGAGAILGGVRLAAVQAVGLATLAALVGGGGFGTLVFGGVGQLAADLILLGVLPVATLSLLADAALATAQRALRPEGGR